MALGAADYAKRIERILAMLDSPDGLKDYPGLLTLLDVQAGKPRRPYRAYLKDLLEHLLELTKQGKPAEDVTSFDTVSAYAYTISRPYLAKLWKCSYGVAGSVGILLACTLCVNRHTARDEYTRAYFGGKYPVRADQAGDKYPKIIYSYWVDSWTPRQLAVKEARAQAWISAGKKREISKDEAITIWGQDVANAVSQDGRTKSPKRREQERKLARAYEAAINTKEAGAPVTRAELEKCLKRYVPRKGDGQLTLEQEVSREWDIYQSSETRWDGDWKARPVKTKASIRAEIRERREQEYQKRCRTCFDCWWKAGKTQLLIDYGLEYRPLKRAEKKYWGIIGENVWALIPRP